MNLSKGLHDGQVCCGRGQSSVVSSWVTQDASRAQVWPVSPSVECAPSCLIGHCTLVVEVGSISVSENGSVSEHSLIIFKRRVTLLLRPRLVSVSPLL
ncbi:hypothetical protein E2C01_018829 [Portunus trituberculatus]|uniref:Uncharacterized protein n=1 Tax=Portunus trituberculatus TaxID=210409 RepID=A0A5B7DWB8_PORTR|nr:hypothetical protein [Portunus trituberculatus]